MVTGGCVMNAKLSALVDGIAVNPELINQIQNRDTALVVFNELQNRDLSVERLVDCTRHRSFGDELLDSAANKFRSTDQWLKFIGAVAERTRRFDQQGIWKARHVATLASNAETIDYLLKHHRQLILGYDASIDLQNVDEYWTWKVSWYLAKKDSRRSWDELKRAARGFYIGTERTTPFEINEWEYRYPADRFVIRTLADRLFAQMRSKDEIGNPSDMDHRVWINGQFRVSALWPMLKHCLTDSPTRDGLHEMDETGARISKMNDHFRILRNKDRQHRVRARVQR
jgi:hypothetical protein